MAEQKILLVEDEVKIARFLELELKHEGYQVEQCHNGREGLETALNYDFDLIILDIKDFNMQIYSASEYGNVEENIAINKEGEDIKIGFNSKYILDYLKIIDSEMISSIFAL